MLTTGHETGLRARTVRHMKPAQDGDTNSEANDPWSRVELGCGAMMRFKWIRNLKT